MLKIGDYNTLKVTRLSRGGCYLESGEPRQQELYLPKKETPPGTRPGQSLKVFVYNESRQTLGATTAVPLARVGDIASLSVKEVTSFGAFLEWGIGKDLFVPRKYWKQPLHKGDRAVVHLRLDFEKLGVIGTCDVEPCLTSGSGSLEPNQEVRLILFEATRLGYKVAIDGMYQGLLYHGDIFESVKVGDEKTGYIKKIREDGQIDVVLQPQGFKPASDAAGEAIQKALRRAGGFLPLHDKSRPEDIYSHLKISKKLFKKTIGVLYKEGVIEIQEDGIRLASRKG
jgi:hypothetical protein